MKKLIMVLAISSISSQVFAADSNATPNTNVYAQIGISRARTEGSGIAFVNPVAIATIGYNFNKNFAGEVVAGTGINDDTVNYGATRVTATVNSIFGAYLKAKTEVATDLEVFARVGVLHANVSASASNGFYSGSASAGDNSFSFGAGIQYNFTKSMYGQVDYMSLYNKGGISSQGPSASVGFNF